MDSEHPGFCCANLGSSCSSVTLGLHHCTELLVNPYILVVVTSIHAFITRLSVVNTVMRCRCTVHVPTFWNLLYALYIVACLFPKGVVAISP